MKSEAVIEGFNVKRGESKGLIFTFDIALRVGVRLPRYGETFAAGI